MEVGGLVISVIGLATLVGSCRDLIKRTEAFLESDKDLAACATTLRVYRFCLEWWIEHDENLEDGTISPSGSLRSLDLERRTLLARLLNRLRDDIKTLNDLLFGDTSDVSFSTMVINESKNSGQPRVKKRDRLKWSFLGRKETVVEKVAQMDHVIDKIRLLQSMHEEHASQPASSQSTGISDVLLRDVLGGEEVRQSKLEMETIYRDRVRRWLNPVLTNESLESHSEARVDNTCEWLFNKPCWKRWVEKSSKVVDCQFLWMQGPAGFGKSVTCAAFIEHLMKQGEKVAYFFYSSQKENRREPLTALRSWIWQLISGDSDLLNGVYSTFVKPNSDLEYATNSGVWSVLKFILDRLPRVFLVIDGFDECFKTSNSIRDGGSLTRLTFLQTVWKRIVGTGARILVFSRDEADIRAGVYAQLDQASNLVAEYAITKQDVRDDIGAVASKLVNTQLTNRDARLRQELSEAIRDRSDGMFLWVKFQEGKLKPRMTSKELRAVVEATPQELNRLFETVWADLVTRSDYDGRKAIQTLRWLAFAKKPLTVAEMTEALLITDNEDIDYTELADLLDEEGIRERIQGACGSLVVVEDTAGKIGLESEVKLFHDAVKEFLVDKFQSEEREQNMTIGESTHLGELCLQYLSKDNIWETEEEDSSILGVLKEYAAQYWPKHFDKPESEVGSTRESLENFFSLDSPHWHDWRDLFERLEDLKPPSGEREYYATVFGYKSVLDLIQREGNFSVNKMGGKYGFPLQAACFYQHNEIVEYLLDAGASTNLRTGYFNGALSAAAYNGSIPVITKLLAKGAEDSEGETKNSVYWAAERGHLAALRLLDQAVGTNQSEKGKLDSLGAASGAGQLKIVKYLVENGVDINGVGTSRWTPINRAVIGGHLEVVRYLAEKGAYLEPRSDAYEQTPLYVASRLGHFDVVRFLAEKGADLLTRNKYGWTSLNFGTFKGHFEIVKFLFDKGADLNTPNNIGWTPLHSAVDQDHIEIAKYLVKNGANVQTTTFEADEANEAVFQRGKANWGYMPVHTASRMGHLECVELLIQNGSRVDLKNNLGRTPIHKAAWSGNVKVAELLLKHGCPADTCDSKGESPLQRAVIEGYVEYVKLLLKHDAPTNTENKTKDAPLNDAAYHGNIEIVEALLDHGANVNTRTEDGRTPLHRAAYSGRIDIAKLLIQHGASVHARTNNQRSVLYRSADNSQVEMGKFLLEQGVDVNAVSVGGFSALYRTAETGSTDMARLLIERGANLKLTTEKGSLPLHRAAEVNNTAVLRLYLEDNCPINGRNQQKKTPLVCAAERNNIDIVRILLQSNADIEIIDSRRRNAMLAAAEGGFLHVVKLLSEKGANMNVMMDDQTPRPQLSQQKASHTGRANEHDASPVKKRISQHFWYTALNMAASNGHPNVVNHLLQQGASVTATDESYGLPLRAAVHSHSAEATESILNAGADINALDDFNRSILHSNIHENQLPVLDRYPSIYSNANHLDITGRSPAHHIAVGSSETVINWASKLGVDMKLLDRHQWSPVHWAAYAGNDAAVKALKSLGVKTSSRNSQGQLPYDLAVYANHESTAELLSSKDVKAPEKQEITNTSKVERRCDCCRLQHESGWHTCEICPDYDLCFRCALDAKLIHPGHSFRTDVYKK